MLDDQLIERTRETQPPRAYVGSIFNTAATTDDDIYVLIPGIDGGVQKWGPCRWSKRGADFPTKGDHCLVAFSDVDGEPWIAEWVPTNPTPGGGGGVTTPATPTALGLVELTVAATDPAHPKVVTDEDPRNTNARTPTAHTHAESDVTNLVSDLAARVQIGGDLGGTPTAPTVPGLASKVQIGGDLSGTPTAPTVPGLAAKEDKANKGVANGYAPLDSGLLVPVSNLPKLNAIGAPVADVSMNSHKLTSVADPTVAQDAATKNYVDTLGTLAQQPAIGARVYHSANQSIPNATLTALAFDSERWDTDTIHDTATNNTRMTCKTAGLYSISAAVEWSSNSGGQRQIAFRVNGSLYIAAQELNATSGTVTQQTIETQYQLAAGDYVELIVWQGSGAALNVNSITNYTPEFSMVRVPGNSAVLVGPQAPAIGARVYNNAPFSVPNGTWTQIAFNSERWDTDTIHDTATNTTRLTCRTAGKYVISGSVEFASNANGSRGLAIRLNGGNLLVDDVRDAIVRPSGVPYNQGMSVTTVYDLAPGDYVELQAFQDSGVALNLNQGNSYSPEFSMVRIPGSQGAALGVTNTLPSNPVDGQECYFLADATNGVVWHLKYRAASSSAYKWECIGGGSLYSAIPDQNAMAADGTWHDHATVIGPDIVFPLAGDYTYSASCSMYDNSGANQVLQAGIAAPGGAPAALDTQQTYETVAVQFVPLAWNGKLTGLTAGATRRMRYYASGPGGGFVTTQLRRFEARPVRVG